PPHSYLDTSGHSVPSSIRLIRRSASSTLFPYTTPFRSAGSFRVRAGSADGHARQSAGDHQALDLAGALEDGVDRGIAVHPLDRVDRKSTRLNSSHVKISYAVFCLKKKSLHMRQCQRVYF